MVARGNKKRFPFNPMTGSYVPMGGALSIHEVEVAEEFDDYVVDIGGLVIAKPYELRRWPFDRIGFNTAAVTTPAAAAAGEAVSADTVVDGWTYYYTALGVRNRIEIVASAEGAVAEETHKAYRVGERILIARLKQRFPLSTPVGYPTEVGVAAPTTNGTMVKAIDLNVAGRSWETAIGLAWVQLTGLHSDNPAGTAAGAFAATLYTTPDGTVGAGTVTVMIPKLNTDWEAPASGTWADLPRFSAVPLATEWVGGTVTHNETVYWTLVNFAWY